MRICSRSIFIRFLTRALLATAIAGQLALGWTAVAFQSDTPVTPGASAEARSLLSYLSDVYGKKTLSGQQQSWHTGTNELCFELNYIQANTGKLPAIVGFDLSGVTAERRPGRTNQHEVVNQAIDWHQRNGIITICWHWIAPTGKRAFYVKDTDFDVRQALIDGTPEHAGMLKDIDAIAEELKLLRDAHVPVLWRPLHEANGRWFWWGAQGAEPCAKLWRLMFERLTAYHHLNNLIWVFSPGASMDLADWYPSDAYVDIIGQDHYPMDGNNGPAKDVFDELVAFGRGTKLVGMSENGPIPDPERIVSEKAGWLFFVTWSGNILTEKNTREQLNKAFNHPRIVNLGDLPDLKNYLFQVAGKPVKLGFPAAPQELAIDGLLRSPLTVAVLDKNGRTIRDGSFDVILALKANSKAKLGGTLTQPTVNGLATFADLHIDQPGDSFVLVASAPGLRGARSSEFEVGPGRGLVLETWTNSKTISLAELATTTIPPAHNSPLLKALEVPFVAVTNYLARSRGWLLPPQTGSYTFWIANQGISEFWLSTDSTPAKRVKIAAVTDKTPYVKWPHTNEARSEPVRLEAGKRYYLEILHKQNSGPDNLCVRWRLPDGSEQRPIPAARLTPFTDGAAAPKFVQETSGR